MSDPEDPDQPPASYPTQPQYPQSPQYPPQPQYPTQQWSQPPAAAYRGGMGAPANPFDSETTAILVTGILSLVTCGLIGIYAWVAGNGLKNRAEAAGWPEPSTGKVGRILGIVGTCLGGLQLLGAMIYAIVVIGVIAGGST